MRLYQPSEGYRDLCLRARAMFRERPADWEGAALLVARAFYGKDKPDTVTRAHPGYYCAMHAIATWDRVVVNQLKPAVARRVRDLTLGYVPADPPKLFERPWFIEIKRGGDDRERLFGNTIALCGFHVAQSDIWVIIGWRKDGDHNFYTCAKWPSTWGTDDLGTSDVEENVGRLQDGRWVLSKDTSQSVFHSPDWLGQAVQFAINLGELLAAEGAPVRVEEEQRRHSPSQSPPRGGKPNSDRDLRWVVRHIYLDEPPRPHVASAVPRTQSADATSNRTLSDVKVCGHIRRQRIGPGRTEVKRVYIEPHMSKRWHTTDRPLKVVVGTNRDEK